MDRLKRFLAIPMAASTIAALWLIYRSGGIQGLTLAAVSGIVLLAALVWIGRRQRRGLGAGLPAAALIIVLVAASAVGVSSIGSPRQSQREATASSWSESRVATLTAQGKPVFVYFTADWCLTCKVNEVAAIDRVEVRDAFKRAGVRVLAADWTNGDPAITRFLESRGRAGVPLYLWYAPGKPAEELPQVLTPLMLTGRAQAVRR
jgi:thiol:disulfide interchange protein